MEQTKKLKKKGSKKLKKDRIEIQTYDGRNKFTIIIANID